MQSPGRAVPVSILAMIALLLTGCATTRPGGKTDLLDFLADGVTTREQVIVQLGRPSGKFEQGKILTFRLGFEPKSKGYHIVGRETHPSGWSTWTHANHSLVLVFDDQGVLRKHSLVEVN